MLRHLLWTIHTNAIPRLLGHLANDQYDEWSERTGCTSSPQQLLIPLVGLRSLVSRSHRKGACKVAVQEKKWQGGSGSAPKESRKEKAPKKKEKVAAQGVCEMLNPGPELGLVSS